MPTEKPPKVLHQWIDVPIVDAMDLVNDGRDENHIHFHPTHAVRRMFMGSLLDYVNERRLGSTTADVWFRTCVANGIANGMRLREIVVVSFGMPKHFMWDWPLSLYIYWLLTDRWQTVGSSITVREIAQDERQLGMYLEPAFQEWRHLSFADLLESTKVKIAPKYTNNLDFDWRCWRRSLDPVKIREQFAANVSSSRINDDKLYPLGSLGWLDTVEAIRQG
jgi:hypothetical protein